MSAVKLKKPNKKPNKTKTELFTEQVKRVKKVYKSD